MGKHKIETIEEFNEVLSSTTKFFLIKHSITCPISQEAFDEFEQFAEGNESIPNYYLFVQDARPLSNYIAETFGVKHESPQALLFEGGAVKWNASHWKITEKSLTSAI